MYLYIYVICITLIDNFLTYGIIFLLILICIGGFLVLYKHYVEKKKKINNTKTIKIETEIENKNNDNHSSNYGNIITNDTNNKSNHIQITSMSNTPRSQVDAAFDIINKEKDNINVGDAMTSVLNLVDSIQTPGNGIVQRHSQDYYGDEEGLSNDENETNGVINYNNDSNNNRNNNDGKELDEVPIEIVNLALSINSVEGQENGQGQRTGEDIQWQSMLVDPHEAQLQAQLQAPINNDNLLSQNFNNDIAAQNAVMDDIVGHMATGGK